MYLPLKYRVRHANPTKGLFMRNPGSGHTEDTSLYPKGIFNGLPIYHLNQEFDKYGA